MMDDCKLKKEKKGKEKKKVCIVMSIWNSRIFIKTQLYLNIFIATFSYPNAYEDTLYESLTTFSITDIMKPTTYLHTKNILISGM